MPATRICNACIPEHSIDVVLPTVDPAASVIVLGFAVNVTWPLFDAAVVCTVTVESGAPVIGLTRKKFIPSFTQLPVAMDPLDPTFANNDPFAKSCTELYPGAFQFNVVWPTVLPALTGTGLAFALKLTLGKETGVSTRTRDASKSAS